MPRAKCAARSSRNEAENHGHVAKFVAGEGYGFIETADGREVYFHRNSVLDDAFEHLTVGSEVRFVEEMGEKGPQASTVRRSAQGQSQKTKIQNEGEPVTVI